MKNEGIKENQEAAQKVLRDAIIEKTADPPGLDTNQYIVMLNVYIMLCEIARRLPPPMDDTE